MNKVYRVDSLTEALALAQEFNVSGKYDLFRGQAKNWDVVSTISRLSKYGVAKERERQERLFYFLTTTSSSRKFNDKPEWFFAVAQHYGLATNFIDFSRSPEVAMFFATNSKFNKENEQSVIICLNSIDFNECVKFFESIFTSRGIPEPELINVNVDSLWRLRAQKGCFLYSPFDNIETFYPFDRILFPYINPFEELKKSDVFPLVKSELELLLDHYFAGEQRIKRERRIDKLFCEMNLSKTILSQAPVYKYVKSKANHCSWKRKITQGWEYEMRDELSESVVFDIVLEVNRSETIEQNLKRMTDWLMERFTLKGIDKTIAVRFNWGTKSLKLAPIVDKGSDEIWNGMRSLPYSIRQICYAICKFVSFASLTVKATIDPKSLFCEPILIEMASVYGVHNRFYVAKKKIEQAFRNDICDVLVDSLPDYVDSLILLYINKPQTIFDFYKLKDLFAEEIIPSQMLSQCKNENPIMFYSPVYLKRLGYA